MRSNLPLTYLESMLDSTFSLACMLLERITQSSLEVILGYYLDLSAWYVGSLLVFMWYFCVFRCCALLFRS